MSQKELGYIELQWTCPNCSHVNPGTTRVCEQCGAPQPEKVTFEQGAGSELRKDDAIKQAAQAGPDIHCPIAVHATPGTQKYAPNAAETSAKEHGAKPGKLLVRTNPDLRLQSFARAVAPRTRHQTAIARIAVHPWRKNPHQYRRKPRHRLRNPSPFG